MWKTLRIPLEERAIVFKDGIPVRALAPGKHTVWGWNVSAQHFDTRELVFTAPRDVRAVIPADWYEEVTIGARQRGVLYREGKPVRFLRPGVHRFWTVDPDVELRVLSIDDPVPELSDELIAVIPSGELVVALVRQHERGLQYVQGRFVRLLEPGQHAFWSHAEARVTVQVLDVRLQQLTIQGQELMTRDKVTLRLTLTVEYAPADAAKVAHAAADLRDALYLMAQLAARDYLGAITLDEMLEGRDTMNRYLAEVVLPQARALGVDVHRIGVKDVVLPGEMKALLNRVIEAEKEAAANVILRREEAAATRSMANTARVIADNPVLLRLKELETLETVAGRIQELRLLVGADGLQALSGTHLLGTGRT